MQSFFKKPGKVKPPHPHTQIPSEEAIAFIIAFYLRKQSLKPGTQADLLRVVTVIV